MSEFLGLLLAVLRCAVRGRSDLVAENLLLRHQLAVLTRLTRRRPRLPPGDKLLWVLARRLRRDWRRHLVVLQSETVVRWHRHAWRLFWRWRSRSRLGRPRLSPEVRDLIARMARDSPLWGSERIRGELLTLDGVTDPLVVATTLPVDTLADIKGVARVDSWRWAIETAFEPMKASGPGRFMARSWQAIDRLLWLVAVAYALLVVAVRDGPLTLLREQAAAVLKRLAVLGRRLTVGKLAEAIGLDYHRHRRAWTTAWLTRGEISWNWRTWA